MTDICKECWRYAGDRELCAVCDETVFSVGDMSVEQHEELAEIEQEFHESMERLEKLNRIAALAEAIEEETDSLIERRILREIQMDVDQLCGAMS